MKVYVHYDRGHHLEICVGSNDTVSQLKMVIKRWTGWQLKWQRVSFESRPLMNSSTMKGCQITHGAHLWVVCKRPGCTGQCGTELHSSEQCSSSEDTVSGSSDDSYGDEDDIDQVDIDVDVGAPEQFIYTRALKQ